MKTPPEALKALCDRIATAAVAPGGGELSRLLRLAGLLGETPVPAREPARPAPAGVDRVGIWERASGETAFVRHRDRVQEWNYWASLGRIEAKGAKRRVVLIGESAARGYLYDPLFTPAAVLQAILDSRPELQTDGGVEVIDLARTDLGFEAADLAASALRLEPDAVVLFCGNNWTASGMSGGDRAVVDTVLREEGIAGLKRHAEERLAARVRGLVGEVSALYRERGIPLVWLVPEFNLGDWRDPFTNAPHLPGTANREWLECWQAARRAFDGGDLERAAERARRMVEIDRGVCVAGLYLLAECSLRAGDEEAARRFLERARDAVIWDSSRNIAPRCYGVAQDALRSEAAAQGSLLVDLPRVFREHLGAAIPDRRLFLDYCHLTAAGIQVAMAAAAGPVLRALAGAGEEIPWRDLLDARLAPSGEVEAHAAFLAAVHNAHWWQSPDVVRHECAAAAQASPAIVPVMERFLEIQTRRTPMLMSQAAEEIAALAERQLQYYLLRYNYQQLDRVLIDAITDALLEIGGDPRERLAELRREEHAVGPGGGTDLLDYYYCSAALQPQEAMWVLPREVAVREKQGDFYKAYWIDSRFLFIGEAGRPLRLSLTCRLPGGTPARGELEIALNGQSQARIEIGPAWETWDVEIPGAAVAEGVNEVALRWPLPEFPGERALGAVFEDPDDRALPELFPCFGEIHAFTAREASAGAGW